MDVRPKRIRFQPCAALVCLLLLAGCSSQPAPDGGGDDGGGDGSGAPVITAFRADPAAIALGASTTLSWSASGADELRLEPGVGAVTGSSRTVAPTATTRYTLTATNAAGSAAATTTVTVTDEDGGGGGGGGGSAPLHDTIAYVRGDGDEIRLVRPDGGDDRRLWAHGLDDPGDRWAVWSLRWNPDATELAFASTHEAWCSLFHADVFALGSDGSGYRRVTQAPACEALGAYPSGTVRVPVRNDAFEPFSGYLYFQGAPGLQSVNLPPGGSGVVVFEDVADFGDGEGWPQLAGVIAFNDALFLSDARAVLAETSVDVQDGGAVTTAEADVFVPDITWEAYAPSWRADGSSLGFVLNGLALMRLPPEPGPLEFGAPILAEGVRTPGVAGHLAWGPTPATADQLLYAATAAFGSTGIYRVREGAGDAGEPLLDVDAGESVLGLAWLPDGSGFAYAVTEGDAVGADRSGNLFVYGLASGEVTRITSFVGDFVGQLDVSGDGRRFVFERAAELDPATGALVDPDLWTVARDGGEPRLLVEDARAPAWSR